ncbi:MAG TPA: SUF system NifU family Fe-S cluster assembly protein [Gemmatimonadaceae bacterium]|nr:SUF system NifU family Fe-S cluster assembly protein [Gemmatimonadaceae bacterium]
MPDDAPAPPATSARTERLHQELILDHFRRPRRRHALPHADARTTLRNPLCGDDVTVELALDGEVVRDAAFTGQGCSITTAAASMLSEALPGRTRAQGAALLARYGAMLTGDREAAADERLGELRALAGVARHPGRLRCALLPADAFARALGGDRATDSPAGPPVV